MITFISGAMFTGKTSWLLEHQKKYYPKNSIIYRPDIDTRGLITHNGRKYKAKSVGHISDLGEAFSDKIKSVYFDEIQFFEKSLGYQIFIEQVELIKRTGKPIFMAGLDYDFQKTPFAISEYFYKNSDNFLRLKTYCRQCGKLSFCYSHRLNFNKDIIEIGNDYEPRCLWGCN